MSSTKSLCLDFLIVLSKRFSVNQSSFTETKNLVVINKNFFKNERQNCGNCKGEYKQKWYSFLDHLKMRLLRDGV